MNDERRALPAVHRILDHPTIAPYEYLAGRVALHDAANAELERARAATPVPSFDEVIAHVGERLEVLSAQELHRVINATGILLHTNLGRAPVAKRAFEGASAIGAGYSNLEFDLIGGERGSRYDRVTALLREITGAQDSLVVNNGAAAVLLILDTYARGREVIVSRNQLIEIGGGFRLPEVLARSGAKLVEVGTTNRVYLNDVANALSPQTALIMRSHPSNYRIEGFVHDVRGDELAQFGGRVGVPVVEDLGSGALVDLREYGLAHERTVQNAVSDGISLVAFSGDKLLGGPQAGVIVGTCAHVARLRSNPLLRALRVDKITLAILAETLRLHRTRESRAEIPFYAMLAVSPEVLRARAQRYADALDGARVVEMDGFVGGGSLPGERIASIGIALQPPSADALAARLRRNRPAIIARVHDGRVLFDLRTVAREDDEFLLAALRRTVK